MTRRPRLRLSARASRRTWSYYFVLAIVALVFVFGGLPYLIAGDAAKRPPQEIRPTALALPPNLTLADLKPARVIDVIDGDTIDVDLDGRLARIRYFGVDTPERGDRCYREATDRNTTLIGSRVLLLEDARLEDSSGRLLRYVFLPDGISVDATLVAEGYASAWRRDGRYRDQIIALEDQARASDLGCLWK